jgi:hypothetical protein
MGMSWKLCTYHTTDFCYSESGIGDHGKEGIKTFVDQHKCDFLCNSLDLTPVREVSDDTAESV